MFNKEPISVSASSINSNWLQVSLYQSQQNVLASPAASSHEFGPVEDDHRSSTPSNLSTLSEGYDYVGPAVEEEASPANEWYQPCHGACYGCQQRWAEWRLFPLCLVLWLYVLVPAMYAIKSDHHNRNTMFSFNCSSLILLVGNILFGGMLMVLFYGRFRRRHYLGTLLLCIYSLCGPFLLLVVSAMGLWQLKFWETSEQLWDLRTNTCVAIIGVFGDMLHLSVLVLMLGFMYPLLEFVLGEPGVDEQQSIARLPGKWVGWGLAWLLADRRIRFILWLIIPVSVMVMASLRMACAGSQIPLTASVFWGLCDPIPCFFDYEFWEERTVGL